MPVLIVKGKRRVRGEYLICQVDNSYDSRNIGDGVLNFTINKMLTSRFDSLESDASRGRDVVQESTTLFLQ